MSFVSGRSLELHAFIAANVDVLVCVANVNRLPCKIDNTRLFRTTIYEQ